MSTEKDNKIFDRAELLHRLCDDEDLLSEVVAVYLEDIPNQIAVLKQAQNEGNADKVSRQGHTIKGASGNVAALRMREVAFAIEKAGRSGALDEVPTLVSELEEQFRELRQLLNR